jgi:hypothetical protein
LCFDELDVSFQSWRVLHDILGRNKVSTFKVDFSVILLVCHKNLQTTWFGTLPALQYLVKSGHYLKSLDVSNWCHPQLRQLAVPHTSPGRGTDPHPANHLIAFLVVFRFFSS